MPQEYLSYNGSLLDGRRKLTDKQKEEIRSKYAVGDTSWRKLAIEYGVSKSLIAIVLNPERAQAVSNRMALHWREYQQKGETWADTQRKHRAKKRALGYVDKAGCAAKSRERRRKEKEKD